MVPGSARIWSSQPANKKAFMKFVSFTKPMAGSHQIHTYTELLQQIHGDLRIQHPEWVQPNGESPMCDSYEARLMELLDLDPFFARKHERRLAFTTDEEKQNVIFDQQRLDVAARIACARQNEIQN
jgi:hypothetical protein